MSKFYDNLMKEIGVGKPARNDGIIYKRFPSSRTGKFTEEEMEYLTTMKKVTKERITKIIEHIQEYDEDCECEHCAKQELGTYIEGLLEAVKLDK